MGETSRDSLLEDYERLHRSHIDALRQIDHLSALREIGLAINSSLDLEETLTTIAEVVQGALEVSRLTIFELDADGKTARPIIAKYGDDLISRERLKEEAISLPGTAMETALAERRVTVINTDFQRMALVPLVAKNVPLGILRLEDPQDGRPFSEDSDVLFQSVGSQIAIAINNAQLYAMAVTDGLTGLYVRRYFDIRMEEEFSEAKRYRRCFSIMLFDLDHFKKLNDRYGHQSGDHVLKQFAALLRNNTRRADICCRYGGEEMAVIMPETRLNDAAVLANKLCARVREMNFVGAAREKLAVTTSIGVAEYRETFESAHAMVRAADQALYRAKDLGRNRVELADL